MTDLPIASRLIWSISFLMAIAAHAAVVLPWVWLEPDDLAGAGGQELDAISFILADPGVLETREVNLIEPATPAPADAVEEKEGNAEQDQSKEEESKETQEKPENEVKRPDAIIKEVKPKPPRPKQEKSSVTGGASARGNAASDRKPTAPAAASAGRSREYAKSVSQALAKTKPKGIGGYGVTKVRFTIAPTGRLSSLQIASSSGDKKLDQKALDAVRLAVFPTPPPGMTVSQLTYEIPYQFR